MCKFQDGKLGDWGTMQGWGEVGVVLKRRGLQTKQRFPHTCRHISKAEEGERHCFQQLHVLQHSGLQFVHPVQHLG